MNDLTIPSSLLSQYPFIATELQKTQGVLSSIHSFEDIERIFLQGQGLSAHTYRSYLTAVKQFYEFTGGLNPLQVTPALIEMFYDYLVKNHSRNTAYLRIYGLKKFFQGVKKVLPFYSSPFEGMNKNLKRKLGRRCQGNRTPKALSEDELRRVLVHLRNDKSLKGLENYALVLFLATSGLRSDEFCQLTWRDLDYREGRWYCYFLGKGGYYSEQEVQLQALGAARSYFQAQFKRDPLPEDHLFYCLESYRGKKLSPLSYQVLRFRIKAVGRDVQANGIIKREMNWSPHLLRRTACTIFYKKTRDIKATQNFSRHAKADTLIKHYVDSRVSTQEVFMTIF